MKNTVLYVKIEAGRRGGCLMEPAVLRKNNPVDQEIAPDGQAATNIRLLIKLTFDQAILR